MKRGQDLHRNSSQRAGLQAGKMIMQAVKGLSMEKWLCWSSMGIAGLLILLFLMDMIVGFPFGGISWAIDIVCILASALVLYLGYDAYRELQ
jgi:hypothetical protein